MALVLQLLLYGTTGVDTTKIQRNYYTLLTTFTNPNTGRSRPIQIFYFLAVLQLQIHHDQCRSFTFWPFLQNGESVQILTACWNFFVGKKDAISSKFVDVM